MGILPLTGRHREGSGMHWSSSGSESQRHFQWRILYVDWINFLIIFLYLKKNNDYTYIYILISACLLHLLLFFSIYFINYDVFNIFPNFIPVFYPLFPLFISSIYLFSFSCSLMYLNIFTQSGYTPAHYAASRGKRDILEFLWERVPETLSFKNSYVFRLN